MFGGLYSPTHTPTTKEPEMILTCRINNAFAWAMLVDADHIAPRAHDGCTYTLEARK